MRYFISQSIGLEMNERGVDYRQKGDQETQIMVPKSTCWVKKGRNLDPLYLRVRFCPAKKVRVLFMYVTIRCKLIYYGIF